MMILKKDPEEESTDRTKELTPIDAGAGKSQLSKARPIDQAVIFILFSLFAYIMIWEQVMMLSREKFGSYPRGKPPKTKPNNTKVRHHEEGI
jgi:hypothetical protein